MRFLAILIVALLAVSSAQAGSKKKAGLTSAQYENLMKEYHRLCDHIEDVETDVYGGKKSDVQRWCRKVAGLMYKTGHLPSVQRDKKLYRSKEEEAKDFVESSLE